MVLLKFETKGEFSSYKYIQVGGRDLPFCIVCTHLSKNLAVWRNKTEFYPSKVGVGPSSDNRAGIPEYILNPCPPAALLKT